MMMNLEKRVKRVKRVKTRGRRGEERQSLPPSPRRREKRCQGGVMDLNCAMSVP